MATLRLHGGRRLSYAEYGDPSGHPVVWFPGTPGSRLSSLDPAILMRLRIRLVTVDRPGCGRSDPHPARTVLGWPHDVAALADALGLERFALAGVSGAGPYLAACAYALPNRVSAVAAIACMGPMQAPGAARRMRLP